ncbi:MAG: hypothetical protein AMXMBFR81_02720 [Chthonomonas sp.]
MAHPTLTLRPRLAFIGGRFVGDAELVLDWRGPHPTVASVRLGVGGPREDLLLSPAFCNAHSHLEYRGLLDAELPETYWPWIRELTRLKAEQRLQDVREHTRLAARENRLTGVGLIGEHSDRPFAGEALREQGIQGRIFQEVITFLESQSPQEKLDALRLRAENQREAFGGPVHLSPHAPYTVDPETLAWLGLLGEPVSIHVAETPMEDDWLMRGLGAIEDLYTRFGVPSVRHPAGVVGYLAAKGLLRPGAQWVHGCAMDPALAPSLAEAGVSIAHCPTSNRRLGCPDAPVRAWLDAGVAVGLGLDSAASGGPVDMFALMRAALETAERRGESLSVVEVWNMATTMGAASLGYRGWEIAKGATLPLIAVTGVTEPGKALRAAPQDVAWLAPNGVS